MNKELVSDFWLRGGVLDRHRAGVDRHAHDRRLCHAGDALGCLGSRRRHTSCLASCQGRKKFAVHPRCRGDTAIRIFARKPLELLLRASPITRYLRQLGGQGVNPEI